MTGGGLKLGDVLRSLSTGATGSRLDYDVWLVISLPLGFLAGQSCREAGGETRIFLTFYEALMPIQKASLCLGENLFEVVAL